MAKGEWFLQRTKQCKKCPWKKSANPWEIPGEYSLEMHRDLADTIAKPGSLEGLGKPLKVMSCHEHSSDEGVFCVGWLEHQLGIGSNIPLRLQFRGCQNADEIEVFGPQHESFWDTLPREEPANGDRK